MKKRYPSFVGMCARALGVSVVILSAGQSARAASATWDGTNDGIWSDVGNWVGDATFPGTGDTATFLDGGNGNTGINLGGGVTVGSIIFDTASVGSYLIGTGGVGAQTLTLNTVGTIVQMNSTSLADQTFNANILLGNGAANTYQITNSSLTNSLNFAGSIQGGTGGSPGAIILNVNGGGNTNITGAVTAGGASSVALRQTASGTLTLSGTATSNLSDLRSSTAGGIVVIDGQTVTVANGSQYGGTGSGQTGRFEIKSGSVAFNGGISTPNTSSDGSMIKISGGSFTASSVNIGGRTAAIAGPTSSAPATSGFVVTGGTANITGNLGIQTSASANSSASGLLSGGSLTVGGELQIGAANPASSRWNLFQVSGGTLTVNDATNGIVIGRGSATSVTRGSLYLTGGVTTTEKVTFGLATGTAGSSGNLELRGGALYVGSGGIVKASTSAYTETLNLQSGLLGAKAAWSSTLAMNVIGAVDGSTLTIKAADVSNAAQNITLGGVLSGTGGFSKTGAGVLTLSNANTYTGATVVSAGTLLVNGSNVSATTVNGGLLGGSGTTGTVTVNSGGAIGAGNSIGTLTTGNLSLNGTGTIAVELNTSTAQADLIVSGALSLASADTVMLTLADLGSNVALGYGTSFTILDYTGAWDGNYLTYNSAVLVDDASFIFGANEYQISYNGVDNVTSAITLTVVPEPSTVVCFGLGLASVLLRRRNRR